MRQGWMNCRWQGGGGSSTPAWLNRLLWVSGHIQYKSNGVLGLDKDTWFFTAPNAYGNGSIGGPGQPFAGAWVYITYDTDHYVYKTYLPPFNLVSVGTIDLTDYTAYLNPYGGASFGISFSHPYEMTDVEYLNIRNDSKTVFEYFIGNQFQISDTLSLRGYGLIGLAAPNRDVSSLRAYPDLFVSSNPSPLPEDAVVKLSVATSGDLTLSLQYPTGYPHDTTLNSFVKEGVHPHINIDCMALLDNYWRPTV